MDEINYEKVYKNCEFFEEKQVNIPLYRLIQNITEEDVARAFKCEDHIINKTILSEISKDPVMKEFVSLELKHELQNEQKKLREQLSQFKYECSTDQSTDIIEQQECNDT